MWKLAKMVNGQYLDGGRSQYFKCQIFAFSGKLGILSLNPQICGGVVCIRADPKVKARSLL